MVRAPESTLHSGYARYARYAGSGVVSRARKMGLRLAWALIRVWIRLQLHGYFTAEPICAQNPVDEALSARSEAAKNAGFGEENPNGEMWIGYRYSFSMWVVGNRCRLLNREKPFCGISA